MLMDLLEDLFGDLAFKGLDKVYNRLSDYSAVHPRRAAFGKVLLLVVTAGGIVAWLVFRAYWSWKAEETAQIWIHLLAAAVLLLVYTCMGLRWVLRRRKQRAERMYDPRYQK